MTIFCCLALRKRKGNRLYSVERFFYPSIPQVQGCTFACLHNAYLHEMVNLQICAVLYPGDATESGKLLRLKQQFFLCSASLQVGQSSFIFIPSLFFLSCQPQP